MDDKKVLTIYTKALNKIQDYFEYAYESKQDKEYVYSILLELHKAFKELQAVNQKPPKTT